MPLDIPLPNFDGAKSSQDSVLSESQSVDSTTPRRVPLVDLAGSPTSKRRQRSSRHTPRRPERPLDSRSDDSPVWVPSSAPTRLANGHQRRGGSPSDSLDMELSSRIGSNKLAVYNGQLAPHSRVATLQSHGRSPVYWYQLFAFFSKYVEIFLVQCVLYWFSCYVLQWKLSDLGAFWLTVLVTASSPGSHIIHSDESH